MKINYKILIVFGIIFVSFLLFNTNVVQADSINNESIWGKVTEGTPTETSLDNIPNTITLDMKNTNLEEIPNIIFNQVATEFKSQGIKTEVIEWRGWKESGSFLHINLDVPYDLINLYIESLTIDVYKYTEDNGVVNLATKEITINWINKSIYSESDKKHVEDSLTKLPHFGEGEGLIYMSEKEHELGKSDLDIVETFKELTGLTFISNGMGSGGGLYPFNDSNEGSYSVFKDGICYAVISVRYIPPQKITVPDNVEDTDTEYINYAIPKIESYLETYESGMYSGEVTLEKISGYWYKVTSDGEYCGEIIIKKADGTNIGHNIYVDNLPIGVNITATKIEDNVIKEELESNGYTNVLGSYKFALEGADNLESPIEITFDVGTEYNGKSICILNKKNNGYEYEYFKEIVENGKVSINVSEMSTLSIGIGESKLGNIDGDTEINARDAKLAIQHFTGKIVLTEEQQERADVNKDGDINARDAKLIIQHFTGKIVLTDNNGTANKEYLDGYEIAGTIQIPKTNINLPVLSEASAGALELSVAVMHGVGLNNVGNTTIVGHNYGNDTFFSNNDQLSVGDVIYVTDQNGQKITYEIYNISTLDATDASYFSRDTKGAREITLSTTTNDANYKLIIFAKEK